MTEAEQKAALAASFCCTGEEAEFIEHCFTGYLFFEHEADEENRHGVRTECTYCGQSTWRTQREWEQFKRANGARAHESLRCPDCGECVTLYPRGRLKNGKSLDEYRQIVLLRALDGALRAVALLARKHHGRWESDAAETDIKALYFFAPGKCQKWRRVWEWTPRRRECVPRLIPQKTLTEPFADGCCYKGGKGGVYAVHGAEEIAASPLKYCAAERYFRLYGDKHNEETAGLMVYLGLWTRYPRIEQLVKADCGYIVTEAISGRMHSRAINWRAETMPAFFRLDKQTAKRLLAGGIGRREIEALELLHGRGTENLDEALMICKRIGAKADRERCAEALAAVGARMATLARYLDAQREDARLWLDYIDAARRLGYDIARRDVIFPRALRDAHDAAVAAVAYEEDIKARKAYEKRYGKLVKKYSFTAMGLTVCVPEDEREIVNEGKTLHHCVGGYAARHMRGEVTILFLRKERREKRSYITIEMCGRDGNDIRQIHGYGNERRDGKYLASPRERHGAFIALWLEWLQAGSRRDKNGRPILPEKGEQTA